MSTISSFGKADRGSSLIMSPSRGAEAKAKGLIRHFVVKIIFIIRLSSSIFAGTYLVLYLVGSRLSPGSLPVTLLLAEGILD